MNYSAALEYLYGLGHETLTMKFGLENTEKMLVALGNPQNKFFKTQIVGTNGKGSVCAFLEAIAVAAGIKVGVNTSPHLVSVNERIRVNGQPIADKDFAKAVETVKNCAESQINKKVLKHLPTFFEQLTLAACAAFAAKGVQLAVLETGLGGRLDSTTATDAEIIGFAPVALDHQNILGANLAEIAFEKACAVRHSFQTVFSAAQKNAAREVLEKRCAEFGIKPTFADSFQINSMSADGRAFVSIKTTHDFYENVRLNLRGRHQAQNAALAAAVAESWCEVGFKIDKTAIIKGLETTVHRGRLELFEGKPPILLDGAHNLDGARALREFLAEFYAEKPLTIVFGAMQDKDLRDISSEIFPLASQIILTAPDNKRAASADALAEIFSSEKSKILVVPNAADALYKARQITPENGLICVTGSLYLLGELMQNL